MNKVLVTGGTGKLGGEIVKQLILKNVETNVFSSKTKPVLPNGVRLFTGDLITGDGLSKAMESINTVIHCASNPSNFQETDIIGTNNLINSIDTNSFSHLVYISIVGVENSTYPYYKAKSEVENMIVQSGVPFTILRTTQFHHFVLNLINSILATEKDILDVPDSMTFQSVDIGEVAKKLIDHAFLKPSGILPDFAGPQVLDFEDMFVQFIKVSRLKKNWDLKPLSSPRYDLFRSGINLSLKNKFGQVTWESFLKKSFGI